MIQFFVIGRPATAGSKNAIPTKRGLRVIEAGTKDSREAKRNWRQDVQAAAIEAMDHQDLFDGPLRLTLILVRARPASHFGTGRNAGTIKPACLDRLPTERPDTVKLTRAIEDALTGYVWRDDSLVVQHYLFKAFADQVGLPPRTEGAFVMVSRSPNSWNFAGFTQAVVQTRAHAGGWGHGEAA